jgi:hypothetical protein
MKYLVMICRGHVPVAGHGSNPNFNKDVKPFLMYFLPKGQKPGARGNMSKVVRHLHLAFKGMETEEVYDVLIMHLMNAINGYDPHYKRKVKLVAEVIKNELSKRKQFTAADVNRHLDIDCHRDLRLLGRAGFAAQHRKTAWKKDYLATVRRCPGRIRNGSLPFGTTRGFPNKSSALPKPPGQRDRP